MKGESSQLFPGVVVLYLILDASVRSTETTGMPSSRIEFASYLLE